MLIRVPNMMVQTLDSEHFVELRMPDGQIEILSGKYKFNQVLIDLQSGPTKQIGGVVSFYRLGCPLNICFWFPSLRKRSGRDNGYFKIYEVGTNVTGSGRL